MLHGDEEEDANMLDCKQTKTSDSSPPRDKIICNIPVKRQLAKLDREELEESSCQN